MTSRFALEKTLCTLGPAGTDAEHAARTLTDDIHLCGSFREAMAEAYTHDVYALLACGYLQKTDGIVTDTWIDLNYAYVNKMRIVHTFALELKPLCIAKRKQATEPHTIVIHPSTEQFARQYAPGLSIHYLNSKPLVVAAAARGEFDVCIGSLDVVEQYAELEALTIFHPQMVWAVYQRLS